MIFGGCDVMASQPTLPPPKPPPGKERNSRPHDQGLLTPLVSLSKAGYETEGGRLRRH